MSDTPARHSRFEDIQGILTGGALGISFLIHYATGANFGLVLFLVNLPFYWLAVKRMGAEFTLKTLATVSLGAVLLNFALAVNHKPGRYMAF